MLKILQIRVHFKNFPLENIARFFYTMFNVSFLKTFWLLCGNFLSSFPESNNQTISPESFLLKNTQPERFLSNFILEKYSKLPPKWNT